MIGLGLMTLAMIAAFSVLTSDELVARSKPSAALLLFLFGVAALFVFGRGLGDAMREGPAVEIESGRLRAFTTGFGEMDVLDITRVKITGRGKSLRIIVFGEQGPRLAIRADIMSPDPKVIAQAIMAARTAA